MTPDERRINQIAVALDYLRCKQRLYALGATVATFEETLAVLNVIELLLSEAEREPA